MSSNRTKYSEEMRERTAIFILESGKSATSVAEEMGIDVNTVCRWVRDYRRKHNMQTYTEEKLEKEKELIKQLEKIFEESGQTYGYRVMKEALKNEGGEISEYKVRKIMKENGMYPETKKKYKPYKNA